MDGINHGWGMESGTGWVLGFILLIVIIWLVVKVLNQNNPPRPPK